MKRYAVHPTCNVSFKEIIEFHKVPISECVNVKRFPECAGIDLTKLIHLHPSQEMKPTIKETIRLSVEVDIEYTKGFREEAVAYARRQCVMHASCYPMGGTIEVKTRGEVEEIKKP